LITFVNKPPFDPSFTKGKTGGNAYTEQLQNTGLEGGGDERAKARAQAMQILKDNKIAWFVGIGPGQYGPYVQQNQPDEHGWTIVNNLTLELLVETGLVGLTLIAIFFLLVILRLLQLTRGNKQVPEVIFAIMLAIFFVAEAIQYQTFSTLYLMQIWVSAGLAMGYLVVKTPVRKLSSKKQT
jgi:O-antigen ligase